MADSFHPAKVGQFLAYANSILQAYIKFEGDSWRAYDQAFRLKVAGRALMDWGTLDLPLYARIFPAQVRQGNSCRDCKGLDHPTIACPWGGWTWCRLWLQGYPHHWECYLPYIHIHWLPQCAHCGTAGYASF